MTIDDFREINQWSIVVNSQLSFNVIDRHIHGIAPGKHLRRIIKPRGGQPQFDGLVTLVFPEPAMNARAWSDEGAGSLFLTDLVI
jgi:hypothetical protein